MDYYGKEVLMYTGPPMVMWL